MNIVVRVVLIVLVCGSCVGLPPERARRQAVTWASLDGTAGVGDVVQVRDVGGALLAETVVERDGAWTVRFPVPPASETIGKRRCSWVTVVFGGAGALQMGAPAPGPERVRLCR